MCIYIYIHIGREICTHIMYDKYQYGNQTTSNSSNSTKAIVIVIVIIIISITMLVLAMITIGRWNARRSGMGEILVADTWGQH